MIQLKQYVVVLAAACLLTACGSEDPKPAVSTDTVESPAGDDAVAAAGMGKKLFQTNCMACHLPDKKLVGPPLAGAAAQWKDKKDLYDYIHNPEEYIENRGDERLKRMKAEYSITMPSFPGLKEEEIDAIFQYIDGK